MKKLLLGIIFIICAIVATLTWKFLEAQRIGLLVADCLMLKGYKSQWIEAARPLGNSFYEFRNDRRNDLTVDTNVYYVDASGYYYGELAITNPMIGNISRIVITTNDLFLLKYKTGTLEIFDYESTVAGDD